MTTLAEKHRIARAWATNGGLRRLFEAEIRNEDNGGVRPATVSSTIDSLMQMPDDILAEIVGDPDDCVGTLTALLVIRDLLPGKTEIEELMPL
jgi:hypothetical protein